MEGEFEITDKEGNTFDPATKDITDRYNSMDIAVVLDLGADIYIVEEMMYASVGGRFSYGMTDINASAYQLKNRDGNYDASHTATVMFYVGFHYIIGGKKIAMSK